jgi:tetratricopeptide (TPR) repeat protein
MAAKPKKSSNNSDRPNKNAEANQPDILPSLKADIVPINERLAELEKELGGHSIASNTPTNISENLPVARGKVSRKKSGFFGKVLGTALLIGLPVGFVAMANLPYPVIRQPVARSMPLILIPSYMNMDHNYRQAIKNVEQADQLINNATAKADIELGATKVQLAQQHLDQLPVWFLGAYPQRYCSLFGCSWRFTFDEFETARKEVARMEAKVFQEKNAQTQLEQAEQTINTSKQAFQQGKSLGEKQTSIATWQTGINQLEQVPPATLAGRSIKIDQAVTEFEQTTGEMAETMGGNTLISAAKIHAMKAAELALNAPHSLEKWQTIEGSWQTAINELKQIPQTNSEYLAAQKLLAEYQSNLGAIKTRIAMEESSVKALQQAKNLIPNLQRLANNSQDNLGAIGGQMQEIINYLEQVKPGTTAYREAQKILEQAKEKIK